jgi:hypothetical protein
MLDVIEMEEELVWMAFLPTTVFDTIVYCEEEVTAG